MLGMIASRWFSSTRSETETTLSNSEYQELRGFSDAVRCSTAMVEFSLEATILSANEKFLQLVGYRLAEIEGRNQRFLLASEQADLPNVARCWESLRLGQPVQEQLQFTTKSGRPLHLLVAYNPLLGGDGRPTKIIAIVNDVTQLANDQQSNARAAHMLDNIPLNVMFADRDLVIRYINRSSRETLTKLRGLLPISVDQIVGAKIDQFHKDPSHQRRLLADPNNLPVKTQFPLGPETIELIVHPVFDAQQNYAGTMASWNVISEEAALRAQALKLGDVGQTVAANVNDMAAAMREASVNVSRTANLANSAEKQVAATGDSIRQLTDSSGQIEEVIDLIRELADQTNLLALNATIEAARAGEAGRSFAVVAGEVKSLASETAKATHTIAERVSGIRTNIESVVNSTHEISDSVAEVSQNSNAVAAAIEEQSTIISGMKATAEDLVHLSGQLTKL